MTERMQRVEPSRSVAVNKRAGSPPNVLGVTSQEVTFTAFLGVRVLLSLNAFTLIGAIVRSG